MRVVAFEGATGPRFAAVEDSARVDLGTSLNSLSRGDRLPSDLVEVPCVGLPGKIVCVGLNYRDHAAESGLSIPERPLLFSKFTSSLLRHGSSIVVPAGITSQVDYEAELAVIIGRKAHALSPREAMSAVFGYTCLNDVSARDVQFYDNQFVPAKSLDTFGPVGPWIVTSDAVADVQDLAITTRVNGETVQAGSTSDMIFPVSELISFISRRCTLYPGDVIATGTPAGVGFAHSPPRYLRDGDVVEVEIQEVGVLRNDVVESE